MSPATKPNTLDAIIDHIYARLSQGMGSTIYRAYEAQEPVALYFIPAAIFAETGLLIVSSRGGFLRWDGISALNKWKLVTAGFKPILMAADIAVIAMGLVNRIRQSAELQRIGVSGHAD